VSYRDRGLPPAEQTKALMKEYQDLLDALERAFREVKGVTHRNEFYWKNYPPPERLFPRLMALAEKYAKDGAAVDAPIWVVMHQSPYYGPEPKDHERQRKALRPDSRRSIGSFATTWLAS